MKHIMFFVAIIAVIALVFSLFFFNLMPSLSLFTNSTTTVSNLCGDIRGNARSELLDSKGYILSYKTGGFSEKIIVTGQLQVMEGKGCSHWGPVEKAKYLIYLKKNSYSSYALLSEPGKTSKYFSSENLGEFSVQTSVGCYAGMDGKPRDDGYQTSYNFNLVGNDYANGAIMAQLWVYMDETPWDTKGREWYLLASDEAYLYSGYGGLKLPVGIEDGIEYPYSTFEIGQTVKIGVETAKGGHSLDEKNWRVTLNAPYSGAISDPDAGGGVVVEQYFPDDCDFSNSFFEFVVTKEMAQKSMNSPYPYTVRIWNTLLPLGTLQIDFVDFIKLCPGIVTFEGPIKVKVGDYATIKINAAVNSETQAVIDYIRIAAIYGASDVLLPSDLTSQNWILHTTNAGEADKKVCTLPVTISFIVNQEGFVTVHAKAFDVQGRCSRSTNTYTFSSWLPQSEGGHGEPPDDAIKEYVGDHLYGGGHTDPWTPWDPSEGNWEDKSPLYRIDMTGIIIAIAIIVVFLILALLIPGLNSFLRISIIIIGIAIAIIQYLLFFI
jgi:hypothetical protein